MSNPTNIALGPDAQIQVTGVLFDVVEGEASEHVTLVNTSDSSSSPYMVVKAGRDGRLQASFTAQRDTSINPHLVGLAVGFYFPLKIYPFGIASGRFYYCPVFTLSDWQGPWRVEGTPAQTIRFSGQSSGQYFLYT